MDVGTGIFLGLLAYSVAQFLGGIVGHVAWRAQRQWEAAHLTPSGLQGNAAGKG